MASIQSLGISGLPLDDLLTSLRNNENSALAAIQKRQVATQTKISAYGKLKDSVSAVQKAAEAVGKADAFGAIAVKSGSDAFSATATNSAIPGKYSIQVDQLATSQNLVYQGQASRTDAIGADGTLKITIDGETKSLDLTGKDTSLNGLMQAINADKNIGVDATIVNDGTPGSQYRLLLTSRETGTDKAVTQIEVDGNSDLHDLLNFDSSDPTPAANVEEQAAENALLKINGIDITAQSNTIKDVIDGVTLDLNQTTTSAQSLTLSKDDGAAKKAIESFVSAYNGMLGTIKSLSSYDVDNQVSSPLTGDSLARNVQTRMRDALFSGFDPSSAGTNLSSIGITTDPKSGELKIDDAKLSKALAESPEGVKSLFTSSTGISESVKTAAETFTRAGGSFSIATESLDRSMTEMQKQYQTTAERIDQRMDTYRKQFTQLDSMVSQMNSLSSYLSQQMNMLANLSKEK